jgi:putative hydrolase of the HAD superfamily
MSDPALLLFDLGGVLIENACLVRLVDLIPGPGADDIRNRWLASPSVRRFEMGRVAPGEFAEAFVAEWGLALSPREFLEEFASWPRGFYPGVSDLLRDLRRRFRIGCLSNSNALHWERFGELLSEFDPALSSHRLEVVKPDPEAFRRALLECDIEPGKVCFFDDSPANVESASGVGMRAFHVDGFEALRRVVEREGWMARR